MCVPLIFVVIMGLLWEIPVPALFEQVPYLNRATLSAIVMVGFFVRMSFSLAIGLTLFTLTAYTLLALYAHCRLWCCGLCNSLVIMLKARNHPFLRIFSSC